MKTLPFLFFFLFVAANLVSAQMDGPTTATPNQAGVIYTLTLTNSNFTSWSFEAIGGTVTSSSKQVGSIEEMVALDVPGGGGTPPPPPPIDYTYKAVVTWGAAGVGTLNFKVSGSIRRSITVNICPTVTPNPTAAFAVSGTCGTSSISYTGAPPTGTTWYWQTSPIGTSTTNGTNSFVTSASGAYYLRARSICGTWSSGYQTTPSVTVNVIPAPPTVADVSDVCPLSTYPVSGVPGAGGVSINWYLIPSGEGWIVAQGNNTTYSDTDGDWGRYIRLYGASVGPTGCESTTRTQLTVTLNSLPKTPTHLVGGVICGTAMTTVSVSSDYGNPINWYDGSILYLPDPHFLGSGETYTTPPLSQGQTYYARAHDPTTGCESVPVPVSVSVSCAQSAENSRWDKSFVVTKSTLVEGITSTSMLNVPEEEKVTQSVTYYDGLAREAQTVVTRGSALKRDVVIPKVYDSAGRQHRTYLPVAVETNGIYKNDILDVDGNYANAAVDFYSNGSSDKIDDDSRYFSETVFESSPLSRPLKHIGPGENWFKSDKASTFQYPINVHGSGVGQEKVISWQVNASSGLPERSAVDNVYVQASGYYSSGQLTIRVTTDEQGNVEREYFDKLDRRVLIKHLVSGAPTDLNNLDQWAMTYYIYDQKGNLAYVVQPELSKALHQSGASPTSTDLNKFAFQYKYDGRNRPSQKQVPGASAEYFVYDYRDHLVMMQDGELRKLNKWKFTKYDALDRPIVSGLYTHTSSVSQSGMSSLIDNVHFNEVYDPNTHDYTNQIFPTTNVEILGVTYYDSYDFLNNTGWDAEGNNFTFSNRNGDHAYTEARSETILETSFNDGMAPFTNIEMCEAGNGNWQYEDRENEVYVYVVPSSCQSTMLTDELRGPILIKRNSPGTTSYTAIIEYGFPDDAQVTIALGETGHDEIIYNNVGIAGDNALTFNFVPRFGDNTEYDVIRFRLQVDSDDTYVIKSIKILRNYTETLNTVNISGYPQVKDLAQAIRGYATGSKTKVLGQNKMLNKVTYYDARYRPIQVIDESYLGGLILTTSQVDFAGKILKSQIFNSYFSLTTEEVYTYDHAQRLLKTTHGINGTTPVVLSQNEYNEVDQLTDKKLHSVNNGSTFSQSVDYRSNIRGWLTSINNSQLAIDPSTNDDVNDLFGMNLAYEESLDGISSGNNVQYGGNISAVKWSSGQGLGVVKERAYAFSYDQANRLLAASHKEKADQWSASASYNEDNLSYDLNGNIKTLNRSGSDGHLLMDALTYDYGTGANASNQLLGVSEADGFDKFHGFLDGSNTDADYTYDANGNLTSDKNKGITNIVYNYLNLPQTITRGGNVLNYTYDNTGRKLTQIVTFGIYTERTDYAGNAVCKDGWLQFINHSEGRVVMATEETLYRNDGSSVGDIEGSGAQWSSITQNGGQNYIRITSTGSNSNASILLPVPGEGRYKIRVKAYQTGTGGSVMANYSTAQKVSLPTSPEAEEWIEKVMDIPAAATSMYLVFTSTSTSSVIFVNDIEFIKIDKKSVPEYQYTLRDHLGNVRLTFTTEDDVEVVDATCESGNKATEQGEFLRYEEARRVYSSIFDHTKGSSPGYAERLSGSANEIYGLAKSLSVMPGDVINAEVYAKYVDPNTSNWTSALSTLINQIVTKTGRVVYDGGNYLSSTANFPSSLINLQNKTDDGAPKAYLNWLVFDKDMAFLKGGFRQITTAGKESGSDVPHELLSSGNIAITEPGYVYIYLSNESANPVEVYFDDFKIMNTKSPVIQTNDYYPFGLTYNSYSRENSVLNPYQYNGKETQAELGLGWVDYGARMYMPEIGRWGVIDPLSELYLDISAYAYALNRPSTLNDLDGLLPGDPKYTGSGNVVIIMSYHNENWDASSLDKTNWDYGVFTSLGAAAEWLNKTYKKNGVSIKNLVIRTHGQVRLNQDGDTQLVLPGEEGDAYVPHEDLNTGYGNDVAALSSIGRNLSQGAEVLFTACNACMKTDNLPDAIFKLLMGKEKGLSVYTNGMTTKFDSGRTGKVKVKTSLNYTTKKFYAPWKRTNSSGTKSVGEHITPGLNNDGNLMWFDTPPQGQGKVVSPYHPHDFHGKE